MKLYPILAWDGIRKNKRLYLPYLLTCAGMVMMFYIIHYLAAMPGLKRMPGGDSTTMMLGLGTWIVALFALIFLFYTHSFLLRRRKKEFGLYHILGMGKRSLSLVFLWETLMLFALTLLLGLGGGIGLSKLAELILLRVVGGETTYTFTVNRDALTDTVALFLVIFALIMLSGLRQLRRLSAVALLQSESVGEKPPQANYLLGFGGLIVLGAAYAIAVSIQNPLAAMAWFFIAVGMVIVATYLVFISGSVMLCRLLQKNKRYYYRKEHFVSVSSMAYRMKRNGAGLASICILSTMVLVMLLGAGSLYFGTEESLRTRYPREINLRVDFLEGEGKKSYTPEKSDKLLSELQSVLDAFDVTPQNAERYRASSATGLLRDGTLTLDIAAVNSADLATMDDVCEVTFLPLEDYNRCMNASETLEQDEVLVHCVRCTLGSSSITMADGTVWRVKKQVDDMISSGDAAMNMLPTVFLVVSDLSDAMASIRYELGTQDDLCRCNLIWSFDTELEPPVQRMLAETLRETLRELDATGTGGFYASSVESREGQRSDFYGTFRGILFLAILLSVIFLAATVLIIYYKQVTEGYEDESRFAILRKVGMTASDIRKSVNSQMLTVFLLPLVTALLHLAFAFPMVKRMLALFNLRNTALMLTVLGVAAVVFGLFYTLIYKITSNVYYTIVSGGKH